MPNKRERMPDISALLTSPQANALRQASIDAAGESPAQAMGILAAELGETKEVVAEMLKAWSSFSKGAEGNTQRLATIEQIVAKIDAEGIRGGMATMGQSIGASAFQTIQDDPSFKAAAEQAARGMKVGKFDARANVDGSIRAALVNQGNGDSNDQSFPTWPDRRPGIYGPVIPAPRLLDVLPSRPTSSDSVEYVKLSVTGDAAEQEQEGDTKAELDFEGELDTANIVTVAAWTAVSKQVLADNNALQAAIDRVIRLKVLTRLENRIINGIGGQGKIDGLLNQATTFVPTIGDNTPDVIGEALTTLDTYGYRPNLVVVHPLDFFENVQIVKDADGNYIFGSPSAPQAPNMWNTTIVRTPAMPRGTGMVLDTSTTTVLDREQMTVALTNSHADFFIRNLVAILGEMRAGLEVIDTNAIFKFDLPALASGP
jgi:HK97 family phage major capsid protein